MGATIAHHSPCCHARPSDQGIEHLRACLWYNSRHCGDRYPQAKAGTIPIVPLQVLTGRQLGCPGNGSVE
jgi:hypothetical protein